MPESTLESVRPRSRPTTGLARSRDGKRQIFQHRRMAIIHRQGSVRRRRRGGPCGRPCMRARSRKMVGAALVAHVGAALVAALIPRRIPPPAPFDAEASLRLQSDGRLSHSRTFGRPQGPPVRFCLNRKPRRAAARAARTHRRLTPADHAITPRAARPAPPPGRPFR